MSQKTVQLVMGRLLTDEDLRLRFVERSFETLTELREQGYDLSADAKELPRAPTDHWSKRADVQRQEVRGANERYRW